MRFLHKGRERKKNGKGKRKLMEGERRRGNVNGGRKRMLGARNENYGSRGICGGYWANFMFYSITCVS